MPIALRAWQAASLPQYEVATQSVSVAQAPLQVVAFLQVALLGHAMGVLGVQVPFWQVLVVSSLSAALHELVPHALPVLAQLPWPLHVVCWHCPVAVVQLPCGSSPDVTGAHRPVLAAHAEQPPHCVGLSVQHTPSVQKRPPAQPPHEPGAEQSDGGGVIGGVARVGLRDARVAGVVAAAKEVGLASHGVEARTQVRHDMLSGAHAKLLGQGAGLGLSTHIPPVHARVVKIAPAHADGQPAAMVQDGGGKRSGAAASTPPSPAMARTTVCERTVPLRLRRCTARARRWRWGRRR